MHLNKLAGGFMLWQDNPQFVAVQEFVSNNELHFAIDSDANAMCLSLEDGERKVTADQAVPSFIPCLHHPTLLFSQMECMQHSEG